MRLNVEIGGQLMLQVEGIEARVKSFLVGMEPNGYLIVRVPSIHEVENQLSEGGELIVRYLYSGNVYGFQSKVLGSITKPHPLTFLSYPENVETSNLRSRARINCYIPASAVVHKNMFSGMVTDISTKGVRFTARVLNRPDQQQMKLGDNSKLSFSIPGMGGMHDFQGEIRNIMQGKQRISMGIEFKGMDEEIVDKIDAYIRMAMEYENE